MRLEGEYVDAQGVARRVELEAASRDEALAALGPARALALRHLTPEVEQADANGPAARLVGLAADLAFLLERGVPLPDALRRLAQASPDSLRAEVERAAVAAGEGAALSEALAAAGGALAAPEVTALLAAGERSARLPAALLAVVTLVQLERARARIRDAAFDPLVVVVAGSLLCGAVVSLIGPNAADLQALVRAEGRTPPAALAFAAWFGSRPLLTWTLALGAAGGAILGWARATDPGRGLRFLGSRLARPARAALVLRTLAALVQREVPLTHAWPALSALLGEPQRDGATDAPLPDALEALGLRLDPYERLALAAVEQAGPVALGEELARAARAREDAYERAATRASFLVALCLHAATGVAVCLAASAIFPSLRWLGS